MNGHLQEAPNNVLNGGLTSEHGQHEPVNASQQGAPEWIPPFSQVHPPPQNSAALANMILPCHDEDLEEKSRYHPPNRS